LGAAFLGALSFHHVLALGLSFSPACLQALFTQTLTLLLALPVAPLGQVIGGARRDSQQLPDPLLVALVEIIPRGSAFGSGWLHRCVKTLGYRMVERFRDGRLQMFVAAVSYTLPGLVARVGYPLIQTLHHALLLR
jgi:hypothetical protein